MTDLASTDFSPGQLRAFGVSSVLAGLVAVQLGILGVAAAALAVSGVSEEVANAGSVAAVEVGIWWLVGVVASWSVLLFALAGLAGLHSHALATLARAPGSSTFRAWALSRRRVWWGLLACVGLLTMGCCSAVPAVVWTP
ncbi:MAG: hypothetical protein KTR31_01635 [Myxococcales bacterium]|nr:hypothetical protein [Myxococcales bacterium]